MSKLETPLELSERVNVSVKSVRSLIKSGMLEHVFVSSGRRTPRIPEGAWERFLQQNTIRSYSDQKCLMATVALGLESDGSN
jgi:hypothetical protein